MLLNILRPEKAVKIGNISVTLKKWNTSTKDWIDSKSQEGVEAEWEAALDKDGNQILTNKGAPMRFLKRIIQSRPIEVTREIQLVKCREGVKIWDLRETDEEGKEGAIVPITLETFANLHDDYSDFFRELLSHCENFNAEIDEKNAKG